MSSHQRELCELGDLCNWWNIWTCVEMCTWCLLFLVMLVHLVILFDDDYFGDSNDVWIICIWIGDFLWWFPCLYFWNDE